MGSCFKKKRNDIDSISYASNTSSSSLLLERVVQIVIDLIVVGIVFALFVIVYTLVDRKIAYFTCYESHEINFPYKPDTIPFWTVGVYGTIGPLFFIILVELKNAKFCCSDVERSCKAKVADLFIGLFHSISLFAIGMGVTLLLTEIGKSWVGRLRPHFLSVCKPNFSQINCTVNGLNGVVYNSIYTGDSFCTGNPNDVIEARASWPSGHSSFSWYTMIYLVIYLEARLRLLRLRYIKSLIQLAAVIAAFLTSISRISDYHHRFSDVLSGSVLGIVIAFFVTLVLGRVLWVLESKPRRFEVASIKNETQHF